MAAFFTYIIESTISLSLFYFFYKYFFYKYTFFQWNRAYFLAMGVVSLFYPMFYVPMPPVSESVLGTINKIYDFSPVTGNASFFLKVDNNADVSETLDIKYLVLMLLFFVYLTMSFFRFFILMRNVVSVVKYIRKSPKQKSGRYFIIKTNEDLPAFSFYRYIFLNHEYFRLSEREQQMVLEHEKIHALEYHTLDVIFFELLRVVFWFNPLVSKIQVSLSEIHEYIADNKVVRNKRNIGYSKLLLSLAAKGQKVVLANNFSKNQLKNRLLMLTNPEPDAERKQRFLIALPVFILILLSITAFKGIYVSSVKALNSDKFGLFNDDSGVNKVMDYYEDYIVKFNTNNEYLKNNKYNISHKEITFVCTEIKQVLAPATGIIVAVDDFDNWGTNEKNISIQTSTGYVVLISGLAKSFVRVGDEVRRGTVVGRTGDWRVFPSVRMKLIKDGVVVDPNQHDIFE